jgi:hypothetical protein
MLARAAEVDSPDALAAALRQPWEGLFGRCTVAGDGTVRPVVRIMGAEPGVGLVELGRLDE